MADLLTAEITQINEKLVGGTITGAVKDDQGSFGFTVGNKGTTYTVWIDSDPEGNGPGHLAVEPAAASQEKSAAKLAAPAPSAGGWTDADVDREARRIIAELTPTALAYCRNPPSPDATPGFSALHDLCDANMLLPDFPLDADVQTRDAAVDFANAITDRFNALILDQGKD